MTRVTTPSLWVFSLSERKLSTGFVVFVVCWACRVGRVVVLCGGLFLNVNMEYIYIIFILFSYLMVTFLVFFCFFLSFLFVVFNF